MHTPSPAADGLNWMLTPLGRRTSTLAVAAFVAALSACGGGGSTPDPISPAPTPAPVPGPFPPPPPPPAPVPAPPPPPPAAASVSSSSVGTARYSQQALLTVNGSNLDLGLAVTSPACRAGSIQRSTAAPNVSTATTAYYSCTVAAVGAQQFSIVRSSDGAALGTQAFTVEVPQVTLVMDRGAGTTPSTLVLTLSPVQAPVTVTNFLDYVNSGFYVGTVFHRNSPGFVLQGGGYAGPLSVTGPLPTLKTTRAPIALEAGRGLSNLRYTVAMARTNALDSATSQFFINLTDNVFLDTSGGGYAVFGSITTGSDQIAALADSTACVAWPALLPAGDCLPTPNITVTGATQTR